MPPFAVLWRALVRPRWTGVDSVSFVQNSTRCTEKRPGVTFEGSRCTQHAAKMPLSRRIIKETERLTSDPVPGISCAADSRNKRYFHVIMAGPQDVSAAVDAKAAPSSCPSAIHMQWLAFPP